MSVFLIFEILGPGGCHILHLFSPEPEFGKGLLGDVASQVVFGDVFEDEPLENEEILVEQGLECLCASLFDALKVEIVHVNKVKNFFGETIPPWALLYVYYYRSCIEHHYI